MTDKGRVLRWLQDHEQNDKGEWFIGKTWFGLLQNRPVFRIVEQVDVPAGHPRAFSIAQGIAGPGVGWAATLEEAKALAEEQIPELVRLALALKSARWI